MKRLVVVLAGLALIIPMTAGVAHASAYTGLLWPTVYGGLADLNGDGHATAVDSWNAFYGDTDVITGALDCNAWGDVVNAGDAGDGTIDASDDCTLVGFDGTANGVTISVVDGTFAKADNVAIGNAYHLPKVYNADDPANKNVVAADFAWQTIGGKVDANGDGAIGADDCAFGIVGGMQILGSDEGCGFAVEVPSAFDGMVDVNLDNTITAADDARDAFFGRDIVDGVVQTFQVATAEPVITRISPSSGPVGTSVTISGQNLANASVKICGMTAPVTAGTDTTVTATVPAGLDPGTCSVRVSTAGGSDSGTFLVTETVERYATLSIHQGSPHLEANGRVRTASDTAACYRGITVKIQHHFATGWRAKRVVTTDSVGHFHAILRHHPGRYRVVTPRLELASGVICLKDISNVAYHAP